MKGRGRPSRTGGCAELDDESISYLTREAVARSIGPDETASQGCITGHYPKADGGRSVQLRCGTGTATGRHHEQGKRSRPACVG